VVPESDITYSVLVGGENCEATFSMKVEMANIEFDLPEFIFCDDLFVQLEADTLEDTEYFWIVFNGWILFLRDLISVPVLNLTITEPTR
jgi:hypothetical protein